MRALFIFSGLIASGLISGAGEEKAPELLYRDDPAIVEILKELGDSSAANLPRAKMKGRRSNDYSMRMAYAPDRQTAMYAGGNHNNGRTSDCWEYHLGSNTWTELYPAEGGDHYFLKGIVMFKMQEFNRKYQDPGDRTLDNLRKMLDEKDRKLLDGQIVPWWKEHVALRDGMVCTKSGAPIMTSHTWDGLCYDPVRKRMLWSSGAGGDLYPAFHCLVTGMSAAEMAGKRDMSYTQMWSFDPAAKQWARYRQPKTGPCPDFRGMGQSLEFMSDQEKFIWYVAASNVAPQSYQMWSFDPAKDQWEELKPNGGKGIAELVHKMKVAPGCEQVMRYSPKQKKLYGFIGPDVFGYDVAKNEWAKVCTDGRIDANDAQVAIAYDSVNDVFIYTRKEAKGALVKLAVFSPEKSAWEVPEVKGAAMPNPRWGYLKGFFHPAHNAYVIVVGDDTPVWVYRYRRAGGPGN